jgi:hypothetical protein
VTAPTLPLHWDTYRTPLEARNGRWYKREDVLRFSNGVNGKVRTTLHLALTARRAGATGLVYGGSVHAPALGRVASAAAYAGLRCTLVIGSEPVKAVRHENVRVAAEAGAELVHSPVAYNPALQARAAAIAEQSYGATVQVPYGVSTPPDWTPQQVRRFLDCDAPQVDHLADAHITTLVVPFGSGNGAAGILYGLATRGTGSLRRVVLVGVGPDRTAWLAERLAYVGVDLEAQPYELLHLPLHPAFARYADQMPERADGIGFHPTYEGKVIRYLNQAAPPWWTARDGSTCMWIIGGPL